jgi:hypothetical protein
VEQGSQIPTTLKIATIWAECDDGNTNISGLEESPEDNMKANA